MKTMRIILVLAALQFLNVTVAQCQMKVVGEDQS